MKKHVAIIGGGVIGLSTAYALIQAGHKVTLLEANNKVGCQTSFANGGQLSYRYVAPLADAGVPFQALQWLGKVHSPLNFKLNISPFQWLWLLHFLMACNRKDNIVNGNHILRLSLYSQSIMSKWRNEIDDFCWVKSGKMVIYRDEKTFKKATTNINPKVQKALSPEETVTIEPALKSIGSKLAGAIYTPDDETADCYKFCLAMYKELEKNNDFTCLYEHNVTDFHYENQKITGIKTSKGCIEADDFVIAAGNNSRAIFNMVGIRIPLYPLKGYSLTLPYPQNINIVPNISVTDYANKIVYAKLGDQLRIAAMVDIGYQDDCIREERINALKDIVRETFPNLDGLDIAHEWSGLRPSTAKGPPILGRTKYSNLWANVGQGSLGFTLAAGSAMVISQLISKSTSPIALEGFSLEK
jgi:D-amino-acid dehydrogenase